MYNFKLSGSHTFNIIAIQLSWYHHKSIKVDCEHYITLTLELIFENLTKKSFVTTNYKHGTKEFANYVAAGPHFLEQHGLKSPNEVLPMIKTCLLDDYSKNLFSFT